MRQPSAHEVRQILRDESLRCHTNYSYHTIHIGTGIGTDMARFREVFWKVYKG
ncbi:MAG: hypothetical protein LAP87_16460 [Acidobacteriia bacterium]|nr:hypothetical protein [Terriglobia bacterium]